MPGDTSVNRDAQEIEPREVYPQLARKYKAPLIPFFLAGVYGDPAFVQADGLHPNAPGARHVATLVREYLQPMLQR